MYFDELYRDIIFDHNRNPHHRGRLGDPDVVAQGANPLCGDELEITLKFEGDRVADIRIEPSGCAISKASASMMADAVVGKRIQEAEAISQAFKAMMLGEAEPADDLGDLEALQGVRKLPVRVKCALLSWNTLKEGFQDYRARRSGEPSEKET